MKSLNKQSLLALAGWAQCVSGDYDLHASSMALSPQ